MKFRYIIAALILCLAFGCQQEKLGTLSEIQVSESYLSIDVSGSTATLDVTTTGAWQIDPASVPAWLTVNPMSGSAGKTTISFSANATKSTNTAEVRLASSGQTQMINVIQYAKKGEVKVMTVAEALALINTVDMHDGQSYNVDGEYCVKGIVSKITEISAQYGNATFYISDDGKFENSLQVYRGAWLNGAAFTKGDEFSVGDELTIMGELMSYKGTPETKEKTAYVVAIEKSLISVASVDPEDATIAAEGGKVTVTLANKGNGLYVEMPEDADWLSIGAIAGNVVTFEAAANEGGDREATITIKTTDGKKDYSTQQTITQKGAIVEVSIADFLAAEVSSNQYRITGVVMEEYASDKNGESFYIQDWSGKTLVYRVNSYKDSGAKVGDIVTVSGNRGAYKESPQLVNGTFEEIKYAVTECTIADFLTKEDSKDVYYKVTGTIKDLLNDKGEENEYGNLHLTDGTNELYVYGCYSGYGATGDARKGFIQAAGIKAGDTLTMIGYKSTYKGLIELCGGVYFSHTPAGEEK